MSFTRIDLAYMYVPDPKKGKPVYNGTLWIGEPDQDPDIAPKQAYLSQESGDPIPIAQPIGIGAGGVPLYDGSPAEILVDGNYSYRIRDRFGAEVYYVPNYYKYEPLTEDNGVRAVDAVISTADDSLYEYTGLANGWQINVGWHTDPDVGGGGVFSWIEGSTEADNNATVVLPTDHTGPGRWHRNDPSRDVAEWGVLPNDTAALNAPRLEAFSAWFKTGEMDFVAPGVYTIERTVELAIGIEINGGRGNQSYTGDDTDTVTLAPLSTSALYYEADGLQTANGYLFFMNVAVSDPTTWVLNFPNTYSGGARRVAIDGEPTGNIKGFYFAGSYHFSDMRTDFVSTLVRKPTVYTDGLTMEHCHASSQNRPDTDDWYMHLQGLGDGITINHVACGRKSDGSASNGILLGSCLSGRITNVLNGVQKFENSGPGVTISNSHFENGGIIIDSSGVVVRGNVFFTEEDNTLVGSAVSVNNDAGGASISRDLPIIENNYFVRMPNNRGGWPAVDIPDIDLNGNGAMLRNNFRTIMVSGASSVTQVMGCMVGNGGVISTDWQAYSHIVSQQNLLLDNSHVPVTGGMQKLVAFSGWQSATAYTQDYSNQNWTWEAATNTYYYGIQALGDPIRLLGALPLAISEATANAVNGGDIQILQILKGSTGEVGNTMYRIYRGTSTGVYDVYVDIPAINLVRVLDGGNEINGFPWITRSAGPVDTLNVVSYSGVTSYADGVITAMSATGDIPTDGTWSRGDRLIRDFLTVPSVGATTIGEVRRITNGSGNIDGTDWIKFAFERG